MYSVEELEAFCERIHSTPFYLLLSYLGAGSLQSDHIASHVGKAVGLSLFLRTCLAMSRNAAARSADPGLPLDLLSTGGISQQRLLEGGVEGWRSETVRNIVHRLANAAMGHADLAREHLAAASRHDRPILQRLFLPMAPTRLFLQALNEADFDLTHGELYRRDRWLPLRLLWTLARGDAP